MYSTKLTSVWNQQKTIFVRWKKKPTSVTSAKSFERVFIIIIFFSNSMQRWWPISAADKNWQYLVCASVIYSIVLISIWILFFIWNSRNFIFSSIRSIRKPNYPHFDFTKEMYYVMTLLLVCSTYTQVVWIVPNHFEIHFFTFQIIFFQIFLSSSFHRRFDVDLFLPWWSPHIFFILLFSACSISCDEGYARLCSSVSSWQQLLVNEHYPQ